MLVNLLPGLREIRAPLVSGYLWLVFFFLAFHDDLPSQGDPGSVLQPIFNLADNLSVVGLATVTGVAAYLVGSAVQELWKLLGRMVSPQRPLYGEAGTRTSAAGRRDVQDAVRIRTQGIKRELFQVALSPGEKGIDGEPASAVVERELPLIRTLLLGERPELVGELDRLQAEADLRITVAFPVAFLAVFLAIELSFGWLAVLAPAGLLLVQGYQRQLEAGDLLAKALRIGKADAPALEALATSADAVLQRVELEGELRRGMDGGDGLAAFRLGNLQASWDDFEAAVASFELATDKGVVRAYAELGLVHERRKDAKGAERAYRDGDERGDAKASRLLSLLLNKLERDEEARETAKRAEGLEERATPAGEPIVAADRSAAAYRRRAKTGDAKAAINLGLLLERQGDQKGAVDAFQEATELDSGDAQAWSYLGVARSRRREPAAASEAYERALALREEQLGPDHLDVAITLGNLGIATYELREYEKARRMQERALKIKEAELGPDHIRVATTLRSLGVVLRELDEYERALQLQERALEIAERELGADDLDVAVGLEALGSLRRRLGEYAQARQLQERALAIKEKKLGPNHLDLTSALVNLGVSLSNLGEHERARQLQERALEIEERELGPDHLETASTLVSLGNTLYEVGAYAQAQQLQERALEIEEGQLGPEHRAVAETLDSLGNTWRSTGDLARSEYAFKRALKIFSATPNHPDMAIALRGYGETLRSSGRALEARDALARASDIQSKVLGSSHPELANTFDVTADVLDDLGEAGAAGELRTRAGEIREEKLEPPDHSSPEAG